MKMKTENIKKKAIKILKLILHLKIINTIIL